jgi:hypothetical protein
VALVAVVLISTLGFGGVPRHVPQAEEAPRGLAERLTAGELVWLIPENGGPKESRPLPGCDSELRVGRTGYATLSSAVFAAVELSEHPLPTPLKIRAEYALTAGQDSRSRAGIYFGRKLSRGVEPCVCLIELSHRLSRRDRGPDHIELTRVAAFELDIWGKDAVPDRSTCSALSDVVLVPRAEFEKLSWHTVEVVVRPEVVTGTWDDRPLEPLYGPRRADRPGTTSIQPRLEGFARRWEKRHPPAPFEPPYIGDGIGVCVFNATAVFRNFTLSTVDR